MPVKRLLCKHENLSPVLGTHIKPGMVLQAGTPSATTVDGNLELTSQQA